MRIATRGDQKKKRQRKAGLALGDELASFVSLEGSCSDCRTTDDLYFTALVDFNLGLSRFYYMCCVGFYSAFILRLAKIS